MSALMDAFARLQLMRGFFEQHPTMESIMEYGRMAQMTRDEVIKYLDIFGNEQWEAMKQKHGIKMSSGLIDSSDDYSDWDDESDAETRSRLLLQENQSERKQTDGGTSQKSVLSDTSYKEEEGLDSRSLFVREAAEIDQRELEQKQENKSKKKFPIKEEAKMPENTTKVSKKHLSESLKLKMIDAHKAGEGYKKISKRLQVPIPTVRYIVKKWKLTGTVEVKARSGRPRKITDKTVHNIVSKVSENPYVTLKSIQEDLAETGVVVHCSTITRLLNKHGLQRLFDGPQPFLEMVMEYGRMAGMIYYLDRFGKEKWLFFKEKHGLSVDHIYGRENVMLNGEGKASPEDKLFCSFTNMILYDALERLA